MCHIWSNVLQQSFFLFSFLIVQLQLSLFFSYFSPLSYLPPPAIFNPPHQLSLSMCPSYMFLDLTLPLLSPITPLHPPLWLLSVCSLFQWLWFYFALLFVFLIRFHLQVRSYGICLSSPGLLHLAQCSPVPSMLLWRVGVPSFFLLRSIPLCKCTTIFWPTHCHMGTSVVSSTWIL